MTADAAKGRIGVLTSGGDCAGLNAAIRAVVLHADALGWEVIGIEDGTLGLLERPVRARRLMPAEFDGMLLRRAGTMLGTVSTGDPFAARTSDGSVVDLAGTDQAEVAAGDTIIVETPGGGGFGAPETP